MIHDIKFVAENGDRGPHILYVQRSPQGRWERVPLFGGVSALVNQAIQDLEAAEAVDTLKKQDAFYANPVDIEALQKDEAAELKKDFAAEDSTRNALSTLLADNRHLRRMLEVERKTRELLEDSLKRLHADVEKAHANMEKRMADLRNFIHEAIELIPTDHAEGREAHARYEQLFGIGGKNAPEDSVPEDSPGR